QLLEHLEAGALDRLGVHEHAVEGAHPGVIGGGDLLAARVRGLRVPRRLLDDLPHPLLGEVAQGVEGTVARPVRRHHVLAQPGAVDVAEEVVLDPHPLVDLVEGEARGAATRSGERITSARAPTWSSAVAVTSSRRMTAVERAPTPCASIVEIAFSDHSPGRAMRRRVVTVCAVARASHTRAQPAPTQMP